LASFVFMCRKIFVFYATNPSPSPARPSSSLPPVGSARQSPVGDGSGGASPSRAVDPCRWWRRHVFSSDLAARYCGILAAGGSTSTEVRDSIPARCGALVAADGGAGSFVGPLCSSGPARLSPWWQACGDAWHLRPPGTVVVPDTGQEAAAGWTSTVQSVCWWRWNGSLRSPFVGIKVWLSSRYRCSQG
jgi:hypothetical protein